jgi:hypothetical protein
MKSTSKVQKDPPIFGRDPLHPVLFIPFGGRPLPIQKRITHTLKCLPYLLLSNPSMSVKNLPKPGNQLTGKLPKEEYKGCYSISTRKMEL